MIYMTSNLFICLSKTGLLRLIWL